MFKLDLTDRKILHELDFDSRQPVSAIARKLKLSRDIINYRMGKFLKEGPLSKYFTIIDISKLGYAIHKNFIRFQNITEKKEQEFIEYIQKNPNAVYSASYDGKFDVVVSIWAKNIEELAGHLKEINSRFGNFIAERQMASIIKGEYCIRNYLLENKPAKRQSFFGSVPKAVRINETDKKILLELGKDARVSAVEIAGRLNLSADAVSKKIKKLRQMGIIQGYNIVPDEKNYPFTHYKILVSFHNPDEKKQTEFENYCRSSRNIWYFCTALGPWDFEIDLDAGSNEEFRNILRNFKLNFSNMIRDYTVLTAYKTNKYNFYPKLG
ncbi:MAG: winged helix-turn-helix transcriptional regulator [Candidatus Nanoarchaeia archaeon]|nr:winged helix-turn-helix transcriptional regulator [Candidatus Nanoarchaeia archaeon]MDD5740993.1 winged helix-turn-helix transcriptional regulator [Candidatus Nanoarchaeia archaeon]